MTRETKIGLLVGLAFIIVIGILLSDHMTSSTEPALAPLQYAANSVRSGLGQPASDNAPPVVIVAPNVTPSQTVLTRDELNPRPRPKPPVTLVPEAATSAMATSAGSDTIPVATRHSDEENTQSTKSPSDSGDVIETTAVPPLAVKLVNRTYKVQPGDSLGKIAAKFYGTSNKAARQTIIDANPSLESNPDRIIVGRSYVIPQPGKAAAPVAPAVDSSTEKSNDDSSADPSETSRRKQSDADVESAPVATSTEIYVVQSGDTLWSIATDELGSAKMLSVIKDLNKDVLKGSDRVRPNMKLKLPVSKTVAVAS